MYTMEAKERTDMEKSDGNKTNKAWYLEKQDPVAKLRDEVFNYRNAVLRRGHLAVSVFNKMCELKDGSGRNVFTDDEISTICDFAFDYCVERGLVEFRDDDMEYTWLEGGVPASKLTDSGYAD